MSAEVLRLRRDTTERLAGVIAVEGYRTGAWTESGPPAAGGGHTRSGGRAPEGARSTTHRCSTRAPTSRTTSAHIVHTCDVDLTQGPSVSWHECPPSSARQDSRSESTPSITRHRTCTSRAIVKIDLATHHAVEIIGAISDRDVRRAERLVAQHAEFLRSEWEKLHARREGDREGP